MGARRIKCSGSESSRAACACVGEGCELILTGSGGSAAVGRAALLRVALDSGSFLALEDDAAMVPADG